MESIHDDTAATSTPKLETANPATTLFTIGTPTKVPPSKHSHSSRSRATSVRPNSSLRSKSTEGNKPNSRPIVYGTTRPKPKPNNKPVAQSVPLAFPASASFMFNAPTPQRGSTITNRKNTARAIQTLPTDVLILVIRSNEPNRHHQILKNLSLVSRGLNEAIAPILYHHLRLFSLREVYDFALNFRYPTCVTSLDMFLTPDPQDLGWTPPHPDWSDKLLGALKKMERLLSLTVKRCSEVTILDSIARRSDDPTFLPGLQKLSFGYWHQLTSLAIGRALTSYGLAIDIQHPSDYESLDRALVDLTLSSKSILELKLTVNFTDQFQVHVDNSGDFREKIIHSIVQHFPHLRTLVLRTQSRKGFKARQLRAADILTLIPRKMAYVNYLELSDPRLPQYRTEAILKVAKQLSEPEGLCPRLEFLSLDGLLWRRAVNSSLSQEIDLSRLTLDERGWDTRSRDTTNEVKSDTSFPKLAWTPCPSNSRGLAWWAKKVPELHTSSRTQAIYFLREWMLRYWDAARIPSDDITLDRAVLSW